MIPLGQIRFEPTINFGSVIWALSSLVLAVAAWRDLNWRIKNLEVWRTEHMVDADSRDAIIGRMDKILYHVTGGKEGELWNGSERRKK